MWYAPIGDDPGEGSGGRGRQVNDDQDNEWTHCYNWAKNSAEVQKNNR